MSKLNLEVDKFYISFKYKNQKISPSALVKIVGLIINNTIDYELGMRFFSDRGGTYRSDGGFMTNGRLKDLFLPENKTSVLCLFREATVEEIRKGYAENFRIDLKHCQQDKRYIPVTSPRFIMILGETYIDRMGRIVTLQRMFPQEEEDLFTSDHQIGLWYFSTGKARMNSHGFSSDIGSMYDLIYQRI